MKQIILAAIVVTASSIAFGKSVNSDSSCADDTRAAAFAEISLFGDDTPDEIWRTALAMREGFQQCRDAQWKRHDLVGLQLSRHQMDDMDATIRQYFHIQFPHLYLQDAHSLKLRKGKPALKRYKDEKGFPWLFMHSTPVPQGNAVIGNVFYHVEPLIRWTDHFRPVRAKILAEKSKPYSLSATFLRAIQVPVALIPTTGKFGISEKRRNKDFIVQAELYPGTPKFEEFANQISEGGEITVRVSEGEIFFDVLADGRTIAMYLERHKYQRWPLKDVLEHNKKVTARPHEWIKYSFYRGDGTN